MSCTKCGKLAKSPFTVCWTCYEAVKAELTSEWLHAVSQAHPSGDGLGVTLVTVVCAASKAPKPSLCSQGTWPVHKVQMYAIRLGGH